MVWLWRNSMNLLVRSHGGASWLGHNSMTLLVRAHGVVPQVMDVIQRTT